MVIEAVIAGYQFQECCTTGGPPSYDVDNIGLNSTLFSSWILESAQQSKALAAIGACTVNQDGCDIFEERRFPDGDPYVMINATMSGKSCGVTSKHFSKIWRTSHNDAARTLYARTQLIHCNPGTTLSWNYGTDDRALIFKQLETISFTNNMFATKKAKITRGHTCAQIYVLDKMFVAVHPMETQSDYPSLLKQFAKEVRLPKALVCDSHPSQKACDVKQFLTSIGTTLRVLEAETQHVNQAKLLVGMFEEATRKDSSVRLAHCSVGLLHGTSSFDI